MPKIESRPYIGKTVALVAISLASIFPGSQSGNAVELGDAARGLDYAQKVCSKCHLIDDDGPYSPNPDAPTFIEIANTSGMTGTAIAVWLQSSHPTMPDFIIPEQETDDLIAYLKTLKRE